MVSALAARHGTARVCQLYTKAERDVRSNVVKDCFTNRAHVYIYGHPARSTLQYTDSITEAQYDE